MDMTPDSFQDFLTRLKYHNRGEGVDDHCTANPIFIVQSLVYIDGIDLDYDPRYFWTDNDHEIELTDEELEKELAEYKAEGGEYDEFDINWHKEVVNGNDTLYQKIGYAERWEYVCAHFTREAAEAFIKRKKHDYRKLRIFVDSQYRCPEFNAIVNGLLSGKIGLIE